MLENIYQSRVEGAIKTLQTELPSLFETDISYDIYTKDIYFRDPVNTFKGKFNYRIIFWTLRFHGKLFFSSLYFDLHDIKQTAPDTILANWTVRGTLRKNLTMCLQTLYISILSHYPCPYIPLNPYSFLIYPIPHCSNLTY